MVCCGVAALGGCEGGPASDITIEPLPEVRPSLPPVPQIPPPPHPVTYGDGSYSVYGLRARLNNTIDQSHAVTGYVIEIYEPPRMPGRRSLSHAFGSPLLLVPTPPTNKTGRSGYVSSATPRTTPRSKKRSKRISAAATSGPIPSPDNCPSRWRWLRARR